MLMEMIARVLRDLGSKTAGVVVRVANAADADQVRALFERHLAALGVAPDAALDADMNAFPSAYNQPGAQFLVAEGPGGALVGMAGLLDGEVRRVFVDERWRGQGVATRLIRGLLERCPEAAGGRRWASVARHNEASRRLFGALGFKPTGRVVAPASGLACEVFEREAGSRGDHARDSG